MVLSRVFLLCLLSPCLRGKEAEEAKPVNVENLARIIDDIHNRFNPKHGDQFALAINIPDHNCVNESFKPGENFLKNDKPDAAIKAMTTENMVYEGTSLIGATKKRQGNIDYHSEYLLMNPPNPKESPMTRLLKKNKKGCVIFYTYYSPCLGTCLNPAKKKFNIFAALKIFGKHEGPKAFVFRKLFGKEDKEEFRKGFKAVNASVPLYRCDNSVCNSCVNDTIVKDECLPPDIQLRD